MSRKRRTAPGGDAEAAHANGEAPPEWLAAACTPTAYPNRPQRVDTRWTHISRVFLAGDLVYKTKKAVRLPFVDASTLERRRFFCDEEVRLNRRLAPRVYRGVVALRRRGAAFAWDAPNAPGAGEIVEWAVVMKRLPEERTLDSRLRAGAAGPVELRTVAERIADFHRSAPAAGAERYGSPEAVRRLVRENFAEARALASAADRLSEVEEFLDRELADSTRFAARLRAGRVREGHGDLRPEHVFLLNEVVVIDCVEFDLGLRTIDVASEIAFLTMELEALGLPDLVDDFVLVYAASAGDAEVGRFVGLYACHRALVRAKIESLKSRESDLAEAARQEAARRARRYFRIARRHARPPLRPYLVAVAGVAGSGKSTLAAALGEATGVFVAGSDVVRKRLAGIAPQARAAGAAADALYSEAATERTYAALLEEARRRLAAGRGAVLDATFQRARHCARVRELGDRLGVPVLFVECRADEAECIRRIVARQAAGGGASDATPDVERAQRLTFEPLDDIDPSRRLVVDTTPGVEAALEQVLDRLEELSGASPATKA